MKLSLNKKIKQRIISFTTAFAMMTNALPISGFSGIISPLFTISASAADYAPQEASVFNKSNDSDPVSLSTTDALVSYCWHYNRNTPITITNPDESQTNIGFAEYHQNDTLIIAFTGSGEISSDFEGLGSESYPFGGTIKFGGNNYVLNAHRALFNYVYDSVQFLNNGDGLTENIVFIRLSSIGTNESDPLLADHVRHDTREGKTVAEWHIELSSSNTNTYSGVIGELESGASVKLTYTNNSAADAASSSDVGEICGIMQGGSSMELTYSATDSHNIKSTGGNAGGLVGAMNGNASLTVKTMPSVSLSAESTSAYAGGLVGELTSQATITNQTGSAIPVSGSITGGSGAGGLFGHYTNSATEFDLIDYNNTATVDGQFCGGVFGVLENSTALTVKNTGAGTLTVNSGTTGNASGYFGGIAGKYNASTLSDSLVLDGLTLTANANAAYSAFGGTIGIADSASYIKTNGTVSVTARGTTRTNYFGGLVGATSADRGVFVDLENFTLNTGSENFKGGGIVGLFNNGVLRLSGTTTMTNAKPASAANCGQLVGNNNNVLTYAASSWTFNRSNGAKTDDLGTWGEVVRVAESDIVTVDSTAHTVTLKAADTSMGTPAAFARTALNIQLNQGSDYDCLKFTSGNNTRTYLLGTGLSLSADISLAGTGITGFMRDGGDVNSIGSFTGTFNGNNHTLTLAIGEKYGNGVNASTNSEGVGQICRHQHNGLFSVLAGTVQNLTVDGTINVSNCVDGMNIGGIASRNSGDITLTKVTANETVNYNESTKVNAAEAAGKNIGGYIGFVGTNGNITINGVSSVGATFNLKGSHESWNVYGGAIGKITAGTFTVNIGTKGDNANKLTNSLAVDISGITNSGDNSDSGGLIGYITSAGSYGNRTVNLNNIEFTSCTVGNAASKNGGGFLGYAWLNTTTNVNGVTVTNGTISNSTAPNVGVMLYNSTGKMKVDSLSINGLTMSAGGGTSLGMIVNKAYSLDNNNNVTGALYLDVLNAGYDLTGTTAPAQATGIFDEIAAYSAPNVINGGAGVISINMNENRGINNAGFKTTGTYQNRLKTGNNCANPNARYYYNVDQMNSSDDGQDLVLWSLNKYAATNISGEFSPSSSPLAGNADLTGLSFYPLASANDNYSIGNLTLTFDYSGIYTTENGTANTDSYNRDPAVSTNQHYLMHSCLFIDQPSGKSLTVTGKLSLGGTFMEDGAHQGVLISGTENGNFTVSGSGSIELDGIKPMNGSNAYKTGYLLINNITRASDLVAAPVLTIRNVYTTNKYSESSYTADHTNDTVAKSLFGAASGKGLNIVFSHIKLDARSLTDNTVKTDVALEALYNAYGTYNSIFTDSTLLASINTDQAATLVYNYTYAEDWGTGTPRYVTYGKEVSDSVENANLQKKYYGDVRNFTNPRSNASEAYDFSTGFLKYVAAAYNAAQTNGQFSRELKVNVMVEGLTTGCGTYNDPYIITDSNQLKALAALLQTNGRNTAMGTLNLPKTASDYNSLTKNTTGARWCTDKSGTGFHAEYKAETNGTGYVSTVSGTSSWSLDNVKYYLANAYYVINANVTLDNTYVGLGGTGANYAFRGIIVGEKKQDGSPKYTITNNSGKPFINVSNGCVVKDINIEVGSDISLDQGTNGYNNAYFGYASQCKYYGGIIGEIMGGDNIIDNSYVTFANGKKVTLSGNNGTIVPVGGYVGVVVFGGLIFKNIDARKTTVSSTGLNVVYTGKIENLADNDKQEDWAAIYVNPIVGRVINGYAVNETGGNALNAAGAKFHQFSVTEDGHYHAEDRTSVRSGNQHTLKNGTKHYSIADIDPTLNADDNNKLDVTPPASTNADGTINVPNAQAMFILSLITQSTSGTAQTADGNYMNSLSYGTNKINSVDTVYGMSHNADYTDVGISETDKTQVSDYNALSSEDTAANTAVPYIVDRYCSNHNARCVTSTIGYYDINLTGKTTYNVDSYTYQLPDSFRGLGTVGFYDYETTVKNNKYSMKVDIFNGDVCTIDQDIYLNKFETDNYFDTLHYGVNQNLDDATNNGITITGNTANNKPPQNHGVGLFDSIILKTKITGFTLTGSVNTEIYNNTYATSNQERNFVNTTASGSRVLWLSSGGVCGWIRDGVTGEFSFINLNDLTVSGADFVGGIIGFSGLSNETNYFTIKQCNANNISVEMTSARNIESSAKARNGIGCFVGKIQEGAVYIYGTSAMDNNNNLNDYSYVKINSFKFANESLNYYTSAGGLVGFAGNGCKVYDIKVMPSEGKNVTIGNNNIKFVGGFVGAMQSKASGGTSGVAVFKNCTVERINLKGNFVGGFYGGKWDSNWTTYSLTFDNCKVIGLSSSHNTIVGNNLDAEGYAGGFIGRLYPYTNKENNKVTHNVLIKDCTISNYDITALTSKTSYVGGFIGYASSARESVTCYLHDSSIENCTIGANGNYAGGIIGKIVKNSANQLLGYNIKLDTITTGAGDKMGAWIGYVDTSDTTTSIQFTGMTIYGSGFDKNIGNWTVANNQANKKASFVFADYTGKCNGTQTTDSETGVSSTEYPTDISGFSYSSSTHVEMPKYPYVNINPQSDMGVNEIISGDGAVLYGSSVTGFIGKTADKTMAAKIYADLSDTTNTRRYTTFDKNAVIYGSKTIEDYLKVSPGTDGDKISTYRIEKGGLPTGVEDFAVIVIANQTTDETTNLINNYIRLVTNTSTDYTTSSDYYSINIQTCKFNGTDFVIDQSATNHGLTFSGGKFDLNGSYADSNNTADTFTLVDVQFKDPFNTSKIAYHLYVPVYTVKQIEVDFYSAVKTGSNSVSYTGGVPLTGYSELMNSDGKHVDSIETWITQYIRYSYSSGDINMLLNTGNVKWNAKKKVIFNTFYLSSDFVRLPQNTYMVLVDPNGNSDVEYYAQNLNGFISYYDSNHANKEGWLIELDKFKDSSNRAFAVNTFNAMIAKDIVERSTGNLLYTDGTSDDYDVYRIQADGTLKYYKYATEETTPARYSLSVPDEYILNEDYYISMYIPDNNSNALYFYDIKAPTELTGAKTLKVNEKNTYQVIAADLYTQDTTSRMSVLPEDQQITTSNRRLFVDASTSIRINNPNATAYLSGVPLYHSFVLSLNRYSDSGVANDIIGLDDNRITAKYNIGDQANANSTEVRNKVLNLEDNYINIETAEIMSRLLAAHDAGNPLVVYSYIELNFDENRLDEEFPQKTSEATIGVNVAATSNLAYDEERLAYTSMTAPLSDNHYYYREAVNSAKLDYTAVSELDEYDKIGKMSQNQSRMGINGYTPDCYQQEYMLINTEAKYNVSAISETDLAKAERLRLTISLSKKTDNVENGTVTSVEYSQISNLLNYLDDEVLITSGNYGAGNGVTHHIDENASSLVVEIPTSQCDVEDNIYSIGIALGAKTGENFHDYANYMVTLRTEMVYTDNNDQVKAVENSGISDYVVYTNAKVFPTLIPKAS